MILGLLPAFRHSDSKTAITSILGGLVSFIVVKYVIDVTQVVEIASPFAISFIIYLLLGWLNRNKKVPEEVTDLLDSIKLDRAELSHTESKEDKVEANV